VGEKWDKLKKCVMVADRIMVNYMSPWTVRANLDRIERKRDVVRFGRWALLRRPWRQVIRYAVSGCGSAAGYTSRIKRSVWQSEAALHTTVRRILKKRKTKKTEPVIVIRPAIRPPVSPRRKDSIPTGAVTIERFSKVLIANVATKVLAPDFA
jgi:hypothetical protein